MAKEHIKRYKEAIDKIASAVSELDTIAEQVNVERPGSGDAILGLSAMVKEQLKKAEKSSKSITAELEGSTRRVSSGVAYRTLEKVGQKHLSYREKKLRRMMQQNRAKSKRRSRGRNGRH